jgi:hypothetical protein
LNPKDIHILPKVIVGIVSTGIKGSIIITGVETCPSCDDGLTVGETDGVGVLRLEEGGLDVGLGADGVLETVRLGVARAFACPVEGVLGLDVGVLGDGVRVAVLVPRAPA